MTLNDKLAMALRDLSLECESNADFATQHSSELAALDNAYEVLHEYDMEVAVSRIS